MQTQWEVEQKFVVDDVSRLRTKLTSCGFTTLKSETNSDVYFRHPCRDLRATDEAFRLRSLNDSSCITYKGKRLEGPVKTRPEIELEVAHAEREAWLSMLSQLGFTPLPAVVKRRETFSRADTHSPLPAPPGLLVTIDEVEQLGSFAEIELLVSTQSELLQAAERIVLLAEQLGLDQVQPRSYLSLLLAKLQLE